MESFRGKKLVYVLWAAIVVLGMLIPTGTAKAAVPVLDVKGAVLAKGLEFQLSVKGYKGKVTWKSSRPSVATVTGNGKVTAVRLGTTTIKAYAGKTILTCKVTVRKGIASDKKLKSAGGKIKKQYGKKYYVLQDGSMAVGVRKIGKKVFAFDLNGALQQPEKRSIVNIGTEKYYVSPKGETIAGWHVIGKNLYYMDSRGKMLKDRVVEGIQLGKSGAAKKSDLTTWQMVVSETVDEVTNDNMSKDEKLRACWNYLTSKKNFEYGLGDPKLWKDNWWKEAAWMILSLKRGNCYHFACAFAAMAHTLGYKAYVVSGRMKDYGNYERNADGMIGHAWCIIDGKYYDPEVSFVGVWPNFYGLAEYENKPFKVLKTIRYAK